jgi:hypothetical protein
MQILHRIQTALRGSSASARPPARAAMRVEELEPRILHSADLAPGFSAGDAFPAQIEQRMLEPASAPAPAASGHNQQAQSRELVFIDTATPDYQSLLADLLARAQADRRIEVVLIDREAEGVRLISDTLASRTGVDAVHIISHGGDGSVQLGRDRLDPGTLQGFEAQVRGWASALSADADLLLYGCGVAETADGRAFVDALAALTGADVAASDNLTGAAALGGDWTLEYTTGGIQARLALSDYMQSRWSGLLTLATLQASQDTYIVSSTTNNYGASTQLIVDKSGGGAGSQRILLGFDMGSIPLGATINSATLQLEATVAGTVMNIEVYELLQSWTEGAGNGTPGAASWIERSTGNNWTTAGGTHGATAAATLNTGAVGQHSWNVTALVQAWINGTKTNNGMLIGSSDGGGGTVTYSSREGATAPQLVIDYTDGSNTAPVLDTTRSPVLNPVIEEAGPPVGQVGTRVASLVDFATPAGQVDNVTDPDAGAQLGIAVIAADTASGSWWYSTDNGSNWTALGAVSDSIARLLAADNDTRLYFQPNADFSGTIASAITFRAWDRTAGANGGTADTTGSGGASAYSSASDSASITVTAVNDAPVLTGANDLAAIDEDPAGNPGTLVSTLVAGRISDADPGDPRGIAVIAVDNTNGSWEYTTDGGVNWSAFGTPTAGNARLLAADPVDTAVRFVPNAGYNGTVTGGLAFRAWDGSVGANGGTANTDVQVGTLRDEFSVAGYANNDGSAAWSANWVDSDGNPTAGNIRISGGQLVLSSNSNTDFIYRQADLGGATSATLSFDYDNNLFLGVGGSVLLEVSANGGASYTTLTTFTPGSNSGTGSYSADISAFIAGDTRVRFSITGISVPTQSVRVDNLQIAYGVPQNGGSTPFSTATAASSITVNAVNDAPTVAAPTAITVTEDVATAITGISFADVDAGGASVVATFTAARGTLSATSGGGVTVGGSAAALTLTGTIADINSFIAASNITYTTAPDDTADVTLGVSINDGGNTGSGGAKSASASVTLNVSAVNAAITVTEDVATAITGISFADVDAGGASVVATFTVARGTLSATSGGGVTVGGSATALTLTGTIADINSFIAAANLSYTTAPDDTADVTLGVSINDGGNTGSGGALSSGVSNITLNVSAVNDAPAVAAPAAQSVNQGSTLVFSSATGNPVVISDIDAGSASVQVTLSVSGGTLTLATVAGLVFTVGDGSADSTMTFSGTLPDINAALNGLRFVSSGGFTGSTTLALTVSDLGNSGAGGPQLATAAIGIDVAGVPAAASPPPPADTPAPDAPPPSTESPAPANAAAAEVAGATATSSAGTQAATAAEPDAQDGAVATEPATPARPATRDAADTQSSRAARIASAGSGLDLRYFALTGAGVDSAEFAFAVAPGTTLPAFEAGMRAIEAQEFLDELDRLRDTLDEQARVTGTAVATGAAATIGLSVGYVFWLLRAEVLLGTMLSSLPAWRLVDPLPVLGQLNDEDDDDDESLESLVERRNRAAAPEAA